MMMNMGSKFEKVSHTGWVAIGLVGTMFCFAPQDAAAFDPIQGDYSKAHALDVRVMSYNTYRKFIADPNRDAAFGRILSALNPDIIVLQEIPGSSRSAISDRDLAERLDMLLPLGTGSWRIHAGKGGYIHTVIASRFPLLMTRDDTVPAASSRGVTIALADLPDSQYSADLYLLGVHLKCCCTARNGCPGGGEDARRQASADAIANWLGDAHGETRPGGDNVVIAKDTPMIVLGDFNLVGGPQPERTLIDGDVQNETIYGPDVKGDWDNSDLADLGPTDPFSGNAFTWQGNSSFPPSRLDRFLYTDSVVTVSNSFVLNTQTMTPAALAAAGLSAEDTRQESTSDHLPIVVDLAFGPPDSEATPEPGVATGLRTPTAKSTPSDPACGKSPCGTLGYILFPAAMLGLVSTGGRRRQ